jgi:hypothetical protein
MHSLTIYGTLDERVKFEGDISMELDAFELEDEVYLALSDGTLLTACLAEDETWKIDAISLGIGTQMAKQEVGRDPGSDSDRITLTNPSHPLHWALMGSGLACPDGWQGGEGG